MSSYTYLSGFLYRCFFGCTNGLKIKDLSNLFYKTEKENPTKMRKVRSEELIKMREVIKEI